VINLLFYLLVLLQVGFGTFVVRGWLISYKTLILTLLVWQLHELPYSFTDQIEISYHTYTLYRRFD